MIYFIFFLVLILPAVSRILYAAKEKIALEPEQSIFYDIGPFWKGEKYNWFKKWDYEKITDNAIALKPQNRPKFLYLWIFEPDHREAFLYSSSIFVWKTSGYKLIQSFYTLTQNINISLIVIFGKTLSYELGYFSYIYPIWYLFCFYTLFPISYKYFEK